MAELFEIARRDAHTRRDARQHQIKNRGGGVHDAAGQTHDGRTVGIIAEEEHGAGQDGRAIGDDLAAGRLDRAGGAVVRVDAHAAGAEDEIDARGVESIHRLRDGVHIVAGRAVVRDLHAVFLELRDDDRGELVLNSPLEHLVSGGDEADGAKLKGQDLEQWLAVDDLLRLQKRFFVDDERDDAGTRKLVSRLDGRVGMARGDHELIDAVDLLKPLDVDTEETVALGEDLDLPFLRLARAHMRVLAHGAHALCRLVLMEHALGLFPDEERLLAHAEEHGNVLLCDNMPLAEAGVLRDAGDDLRHVMAQDVADGLGGFNFLHLDHLNEKGVVCRKKQTTPFWIYVSLGNDKSVSFSSRKAAPFPAAPRPDGHGQSL